MIYAIISDIHGNYPALKAVLADAQAHGANKYLLLGDYTNSFPFQNKVVETLRGLPATTIIRGNHENYIRGMYLQKIDGQLNDQLSPLIWSYKQHSLEDLKYLCMLPEKACVMDEGSNIYLAHDFKDISFRLAKLLPPLFNPDGYADLMRSAPFTHEEYLSIARDALLTVPEAAASIRELLKGVYLFGHSHIQFFMEFEGRWFINPGSCGFANDYDVRAAYTLITRTFDSENNWYVQEQRVNYDMDTVINAMQASSFASECPEWHKIFMRQLIRGDDYFTQFIRYVAATARELGETADPVSSTVFNAAAKTWEATTFNQ